LEGVKSQFVNLEDLNFSAFVKEKKERTKKL